VSRAWDDTVSTPAARRRLLTWRRGAAAAVLAALAAAAAAAIWLATTDPLARGGTTGAPGGTASFTAIEDGVHDPVFYVDSRRAGTFTIGFDLENRGRLPVTVEGLEAPTRFELGMGQYPMYESPDGFAIGPVVPFEPVTIEPGQGRYFEIRLPLAGDGSCDPDGSLIYGPPTFRFAHAGVFERTVTPDPGFAIVARCRKLPPGYSVWGD
jgi:hypothetical protein